MKICFCGDVHFCTHSSIVRKQGKVFSQRLEYLINSINWVEEQAYKNQCDFIVYLGDFFDRNNLTAKELTALDCIQWSPLPRIFLVGNHEMDSHDLFLNSTEVFNHLLNSTVIHQPVTHNLCHDYDITFIPYQLPQDIKDSIANNIINFNKKHIICSHLDIKGIQMGKFISEIGYSVDDILDSCDLMVNGHLHNGCEVVNRRIINLGNICGQNFSEDAFQYSHKIMIMDVNDSISYSYIENPFALNFYKFDYNGNTVLPKLKNNAVVTVKTEDPVSLKQKLSDELNIVEYRIIQDQKKINSTQQNFNQHISIDHISEFKNYMINTYENTKFLMEELSQL